MKLQLTIVVVIAIMLAYVYLTRNRCSEGISDPLLGASGKKLLGGGFVKSNVPSRATAWKAMSGGKAEPSSDIFHKWYDALLIWQEDNNTNKYPVNVQLLPYRESWRGGMHRTWEKMYGKKKKPLNSIFYPWFHAIRYWQRVNKTIRLPNKNIKIRDWAQQHKKDVVAQEKKAAADAKAERERKEKAAKDKAAREEAARKAIDPCEYVKLHKK